MRFYRGSYCAEAAIRILHPVLVRFCAAVPVGLVATAVGLLLPLGANAQVPAFPNTSAVQATSHALDAKAPPDECYAGLGLTTASFTMPPCPPANDPSATQNKVNQGYIWAMTGNGDDIWYGTLANGQCVTQGGITNPATPPDPYATSSWACEFGSSNLIENGVLPASAAIIGDFRPPRIYLYNKSSKSKTDVTPKNAVFVDANTNPEGLVPLLRSTLGIRAAATITPATGGNPIVLLAGTNLTGSLGLTFFAFDAVTHAYLGSRGFPGYSQIRQFANVGGAWYTAVGRNSCQTAPTPATPGISCGAANIGGSIVKVAVAPTATCANPYANPPTPTTPCFNVSLTEVGRTDGVGAYLADYNNRLYVTTWPDKNLPGVLAKLFMSPTLPPAGGLPLSPANWTSVWSANQFEPDPGVVNFYSGGALRAFDGYLFWGTLMIPMQAAGAFTQKYCPGEVFNTSTQTGTPCSKNQLNQIVSGTLRPITIFRGKNLDSTPQIDIAYGDAKLPVFTPSSSTPPGTWALQPNKMGKKALFGPAGFGNPWNTYTWTANVWNNKLWIGTMDWSFMAQQGSAVINAQGGVIPPELFAVANYGADLYYMNSGDEAAFPESTNGLGNPANFGFRNSLVSGDLFLGTANPMNLLTSSSKSCPPTHGPACLGGWELTQLTPKPENTPFGSNVTVSLNGGVSVTFCNVTNGGNTSANTVTNPFNPNLSVNPLLPADEISGPSAPPGTQTPAKQYTLVYTSAAWRQDCPTANLATVTVPRPSNLMVPRLFQLQWDGSQYNWGDTTAAVDWSGGTITGNITKAYFGTVAVMDRINYFGQFSGALVVPPQNNKGSGQIHIQAKPSQTTTAAFVNFTTGNISNFIQADLHLGAAGTDGPVIAVLSGPFSPPKKTSGSLFNGTITSTNLIGPAAGWTISQFMQKVADGMVYADVHTSDAPNGLIRAQVQ